MSDLNTKMAAQATPTDPAVGAVAITGSNQTLATTGRAVYIAADGNLVCTFQDGSTATLVGLKGGQVYPFAIRAITGSGTTATGHVLL